MSFARQSLGSLAALVFGIAASIVLPRVLGAEARGVDPTLMALALLGSLASLIGLLARRFLQLGGRLDLYNGLDIGRTVLFLLLALVAAALLPRQAVGATS